MLPQRLIRAALARSARSESALTRPSAAGLPDLQAWFAAELGRVMAPGVARPSARDVVVLPGSQSGLGALFRSIVGTGRPLLIESPSYWGAILSARQIGVQIVPIPSGPQGPDVRELERAFARTGARAFYAQPNYANPTGAQWSKELGDRILDVVREYGAFLIEDDWAHDFGISNEPMPLAVRDNSGHVLYLRSLTKSVSPAVRVAAMIVRGPARERLLNNLQAQSMYVSGVLQQTALDVVTQPGWTTHLKGLRSELQHRRDQLIAAVQEYVPQARLTHVPRGGLNLWLQLPEHTDLMRLEQDCLIQQVAIAGGDEWFPAEPAGCYLRLNYSGTDPAGFIHGAQVIGQQLSAQGL